MRHSTSGVCFRKTPGPVRTNPWSPFIPGNDKKKDEPEKKA